MRTTSNIAVIGAGPAGASAALRLGRAGREVVLLERDAQDSHKMCGEFISAEAVSYLDELGVSLEQLGAVELGELAIFGARRTVALELPFRGWGLSRRALDAALVREASRAGVEVSRGARVTGIEASPSGSSYQLQVATAPLDAATVFLATGKHDLRSHRRPPGKQNDLVAFKMHYALGEAQRRDLQGRVELGLFDGGYVGLQPIEHGLANLCFVIERQRLRALENGWEQLVQQLCSELPHLATRLGGALPCWHRPLTVGHIPYGFRQTRARDGLWSLGDQAAVIPSFSGDGISIALHSARLATQLFLAGHSADDFQRQLSAQLARQVRIATWVSRTMVRPSLQQTIIRLAGMAPGVIRALARETRVAPWALSATAAE